MFSMRMPAIAFALLIGALPRMATAQETPPTPLPAAEVSDPQTPQTSSAPPPPAVEYSDAYHTRAKVHRLASFATLPLFVTEGVLGQSLYNNPTNGKKDAHLVVATAIGGLFGINTVTGVW